MSTLRRLILALVLSAGIAPAMAQPAPVPALPDAERRTSYSISASLCSCSVGFALYGDSTDFANWLEVFVNGVLLPQSGNWTIASPSGPISTLPRPITDAVLTFAAAQTGTIQIVGARRPRRTSQFQESQPVPTRNFNQVFSDIIATQRELWDKTNDFTGRSVRTPPGETMALLPVLASRLNMGACFDSGGNLTSCVGIPSSSLIAGNGISLTGVGPTTITNNIQAGNGIAITGTNPLVISTAAGAGGAKCDVVQTTASTVTISSGSPNLNVVGASFVSGDVGKVISVPGAGTTSAGIISTLNTTISSVTDATHVVLGASAATSVAGTASVTYGSDDTTAFQTSFGSTATKFVDLTAAAGCMITATINITTTKAINGTFGQTVLYLRQLSGTAVIGALNITANNVSLTNFGINSDSGSTITVSTAAGLINANSNAIYLRNMDLNGNKSTQLKPAMVALDAMGSNSNVLTSHFGNFPSYMIHAASRASHVLIQGNRLDHGPKVGSAAGVVVFNSAGLTGAQMGDIRISDNFVDMSDLAVADMNTAFFLWGGDASNFAYDQIVVSNNNVVGTPGATASTSGGVIFFNSNHVTVSGNNFKYVGECVGAGGSRVAVVGNTFIGCGTYGGEISGNDVLISDNTIDAENQTPFGFSIANCVNCVISNNVIDGSNAPAAFTGMIVYVQSGAVSNNVTINGNSIAISNTGASIGVYLFITAGATTYTGYTVSGNTFTGGGASSIAVLLNGTATTQSGFLVGPNAMAQGTGVNAAVTFTAFCYVAGSNRSTTKTTGGGFPGACQ